MTGWLVTVVVLACTSMLLARQVFLLSTRLLELRREFDIFRSDSLMFQRRSEMEHREFVAQIGALRMRQDEWTYDRRGAPSEPDDQTYTLEQLFSENTPEPKRAPPKPQVPSLTSFERILKDDPEDPV
jgi:hypothetical protein